MKRITLIISILFFIQLGVSASANQTYDNLANGTYDAVNPPQNVQLIGEFDGENLSYAFLSTNETGKFKNRTAYGVKNISGTSPVNATFNWTNRNNVVQRKKVGWRVWSNTTQGEYLSTNISTFDIIEYPVIEKIILPDTQYDEGVKFKARVTDIVGRADVQNVTFKVNKPTGQSYSLTGKRGKEINESGREGYIWTANFTRTDAEGLYTVKVIAEDEVEKREKEDRFEVSAPLFPSVPGFTFNPFSLGGTPISNSVTAVIKDEQVLIGVGALIGLGGLVVGLAFLGRRFEENEYEEVRNATLETQKL